MNVTRYSPESLNIKVREWLLDQGYSYKGVLNARPKKSTKPSGFGQVPVPDRLKDNGSTAVLIDHQGIKNRPVDLIWIEAKGSGVGMSQLLEGFSRMAYAVYHGGGRGLLAIPTVEFEMMFTQRTFLGAIVISAERPLGLLDAENRRVEWLR